MYGIPAKRFDYDIYREKKLLKKIDFGMGFVVAGLLWVLLFRWVWYAAIIIIIPICVWGLLAKFERRYLIYGALALVFFPLILWSVLRFSWFGRNEVNG